MFLFSPFQEVTKLSFVHRQYFIELFLSRLTLLFDQMFICYFNLCNFPFNILFTAFFLWQVSLLNIGFCYRPPPPPHLDRFQDTTRLTKKLQRYRRTRIMLTMARHEGQISSFKVCEIVTKRASSLITNRYIWKCVRRMSNSDYT